MTEDRLHALALPCLPQNANLFGQRAQQCSSSRVVVPCVAVSSIVSLILAAGNTCKSSRHSPSHAAMFCLPFVFWDRVTLCSPRWTEAHRDPAEFLRHSLTKRGVYWFGQSVWRDSALLQGPGVQLQVSTLLQKARYQRNYLPNPPPKVIIVLLTKIKSQESPQKSLAKYPHWL